MERLSKTDLVSSSTPTKKLSQAQSSVSIDQVASPSNSGVKKFFKKKFSITESQAQNEQIEFDQVGLLTSYSLFESILSCSNLFFSL